MKKFNSSPNFERKKNKFQLSNKIYVRTAERSCIRKELTMWRLIRHFENNLKFFGVDKMRQMPIKAVINEKLNSWSGIIRQAGSVIFPNAYMQKRSNTPTEFDSDVKDKQFPLHSSRNDSKCLDNGANCSIPFDTKLLEFRELAPYKSNKTQRKMLENNNVSNDMHIPSTSNVAPPVLEENTVLNKGVFEKRIFDVNPEKMNKQQSLCVGGRFQNPWTTWKALTFTNALKFVFSKNKSEVPSKENLDSILPIFKQEFSRMRIPNNGIRVTWMGHSTVLVQMHGLNILTDPMFSDRASPSQAFGPKRYRSAPCSIHDLPHINAVVISHNHYDHLDLSTVTSLNERFGAKTHWFVPLGLQSWMQQAGCENVVEMDWWEESCIPDHGDILFIFTPAQHWSKRSLTDDNKVLWGSWSILGSKFRFFFAGDTGYCNAFKQIGNFYGPFDISAIPMGAYEPRWFMKYAHVNPEEAVRMHLDIRSKCSLGIHWGTFCLGTEHYLDPLLKLQESLDHHKIPRESFFTLRHGESRLIGQ